MEAKHISPRGCIVFIKCLFSCFSFSTALPSDVRTHVVTLLKRHNIVFGNYRWTEFDEEFLQKHVESVVLVDLGVTVVHASSILIVNAPPPPTILFNVVAMFSDSAT